MAHHHHDDDTYFLDQICMVALSGAFGVICLSLYFVQTEMLYRLLGTQFHPFVLGSGFALVTIAVLQAARLWSMAGSRAQTRENQHAHGKHETHDHVQGHDNCAHPHSHGHTDHDHGWAPWRYVVLLVPIFLFMLGLPNKGPSIDIRSIPEIDTSSFVAEEFVYISRLAGLGADAVAAIGMVVARHAVDADANDAEIVSVKQLIDMASRAVDREYYKDKTIRVRGQYAPRSQRYFELVRFRMSCCPGDATQISVPVIAKDDIAFAKNIWIDVSGRFDFSMRRSGFDTVVVVSNRRHVRPCNPDLNPYLQ